MGIDENEGHDYIIWQLRAFLYPEIAAFVASLKDVENKFPDHLNFAYILANFLFSRNKE